MRRRLGLLGALLTVSCSDSPSEAPTIATVEVYPPSLAMQLDEVRPLAAVVKATNGAVLHNRVTWISQNTQVATVDTTGMVHAVASGSAVITASVEGRFGHSQIVVVNPTPALEALVPLIAVAGGDAFTITALGSGFVQGSEVRWNGAPRPTSFVSPLQLTAEIGAADIATPGSAQVTVFTGPPGGGTAPQLTFTVAGARLVSITPNGAIAGGSDFTLTVNGADLTHDSQIVWDGAPRPTTFVSPSQLTAEIGATDISAAGTRMLSVDGGPGPAVFGSLPFIVSASGNSIRAVYALASDQAVNPTAVDAIAHEIRVVNEWFGTQTGAGVQPHWVGGSSPTVTVLTLPKTRTQYEAAGDSLFSVLGRDVTSLAPPDPGQKTFVWLDVRHPYACGEAGRDRVLAVIYEAACDIYPSASSTWPYNATYLLAHELTHLLGAVPECAPHYDGTGHTDDSPRDVLYGGWLSRDWLNLALDVNRNDYYGTLNPSCPGIEVSPAWWQPVISGFVSDHTAGLRGTASFEVDGRVIRETLQPRAPR